MARLPSTSELLTDALGEPGVLRWTTKYLKRLLIERPAIRAKLENPGGSIILGPSQSAHTLRGPEYSSVIGNDFHLDLLEAEMELATYPIEDQIALLEWAESLPERRAAEYLDVRPGSIRRRAERRAHDLVGRLNSDEEAGGAG